MRVNLRKKKKIILIISAAICLGQISLVIGLSLTNKSDIENNQKVWLIKKIRDIDYGFLDSEKEASSLSANYVKTWIINNKKDIFIIPENLPSDYSWEDNIVITKLNPNDDKGVLNFNFRLKNATNQDNNSFIDVNGIFRNLKIPHVNSWFNKENIVEKEKIKYDNFTSYGSQVYSDSNPRLRNINNQTYNDNQLLINKYSGSNPEFKYPAWNVDYKNEQNRYIMWNNTKIDLRKELLNETTSSGKKYNDVNFLLEEIKNNRLKKHPAADLMYGVNINDIKYVIDRTFNISSSMPGYYSTGLWAPAGEIIEIEFDDETFKQLQETNFNGITFDINHNFWDNHNENDTGGISTRYPYLKTTFSINPNEKVLKIGSAFGGNIVIGINQWLVGLNNKKSVNIKLTIKNAIKGLYYVHGLTTIDDWNHQMEDLIKGQIAPSFDGDLGYANMNIPFTSNNEIGHVNFDKIKYPYETFSKLTDFLFLSNYFQSRDIIGNIRKLDMQFNDDVWGGAAGWGGGDSLYVGSSTGSETFLKGANNFGWWSFSQNWLAFHEINHNYQVDDAMFKFVEENNMHPKANEVNLFNFAMQGDMGRWRNTWNFYAENNKIKPGYKGNNPALYNNQFSAIAHYIEPYYNRPEDPNNIGGSWQGNNTDDNTLYSLIMHAVGPKKYAEYIRWAITNYPANDNNKNYTYMGEIEKMSDFFGINLWPAINKLTNMKWKTWSPFWVQGANGPKDRWPENYNSATDLEKQIIDRLNTNYKAVDFVGNLFAVGSYIYNQKTEDFTYTSDSVPAYEIPPVKPYVMDFSKYIVSFNPYFKWDNLSFSKPKYGELIKDSSNDKVLIYKPNSNYIDQIDEFDITINPSDFNGKEKNYVPAYKWKIKIRQNVNSAHFRMTGNLQDQQMWNNSNTMFDRILKESAIGEWDYGQIRQWCFDDIQRKWKKQGLNTKFRFVALEEGKYEFNFKWANAFRIKIDNKLVYSEVKPEQSGINNVGNYKYEKNMQKGDSLLFEIDVISNNNVENNMDAPGQLDLQTKLNDVIFPYEDNLLSPYVDELLLEDKYINYLVKEKYQYKPRLLDYEMFNKDNDLAQFTNNFNVPQEQITEYRSHDTKYWTNGYDNDVDNNHWFNVDMKDDGWYLQSPITNKEFDVWLQAENSKIVPTKNVAIYHNLQHHNKENGIPEIQNVTITNEKNEEIKVYDKKQNIGSNVIYNHEWYLRKEVVNFEKIHNTKKIKIHFINNHNDRSYFSHITMGNGSLLPTLKQEYITLNNNKVKIDNNWLNLINDDKFNIGNFNNSSFYSDVPGAKIEFTIRGVNGFGISGRGDMNDSLFDVFINGILVDRSLIHDGKREFNKTLYFNLDLHQNKTYKITIVQKERKPLYLNYITTFKKL